MSYPSLYNSYEFYFGKRKLALAPWWLQVNDALEDQGRAQITYGRARDWHAEGLTPEQAVQRELDNLDAAQEVRSYYDY